MDRQGEGRDKERKDEEEPDTKNHANFNDEKWEGTFRRLKAFKIKFGHTQIPYRYPEDPKLGRWVSIQRSLYKRLRDGTDESSTLTEERIQKLDDIGFEWTSADHRSIPWELRYQELVEFVRKYGHSQVPIRWADNVQLATWVSTQRQEYKYLQTGRPTRLTQERIKKLNDLSFVWNAKQKRVPDEEGEGQGQNDSVSSTSEKKATPVDAVNSPAAVLSRGEFASLSGEQDSSETVDTPNARGPTQNRARSTTGKPNVDSNSARLFPSEPVVLTADTDYASQYLQSPGEPRLPHDRATRESNPSSATFADLLPHRQLPYYGNFAAQPFGANSIGYLQDPRNGIGYFQDPRTGLLIHAYPLQGIAVDRSLQGLNDASPSLTAAAIPSLQQVGLQPAIWPAAHASIPFNVRLLPSLPAAPLDLRLASLPPSMASDALLRQQLAFAPNLRNGHLQSPQPAVNIPRQSSARSQRPRGRPSSSTVSDNSR